MACRLLEHTADMGIACEAVTLPELFTEVARGLLLLLGGEPAADEMNTVYVTVSGGDREELLVNWLNELLFLFETRRFYLARVEKIALDGLTLTAELLGEPIDPQRHSFTREAKAATHHQLRLIEGSQGWSAQVYLDL